jgi:hypothetical protein
MRSTESGFNEEVYLAAAREQLAAAEDLERQEHFVAAAYLAGVSVELLLLAYLTRTGGVYDAGHSLFPLFYGSGFLDGLTDRERDRLDGELDVIALRWRNNHRYRSERAYREFLVRQKLYEVQGRQTLRGDVVTYNTRRIVESAGRLIESGVSRWSSRTITS